MKPTNSTVQLITCKALAQSLFEHLQMLESAIAEENIVETMEPVKDGSVGAYYVPGGVGMSAGRAEEPTEEGSAAIKTETEPRHFMPPRKPAAGAGNSGRNMIEQLLKMNEAPE